MFILEAIVGQMDAQIFLIFNIDLRVVFNGQSKISRVEKSNARTAVVEKVTSDIKFLLIEQKRSNVVLDEAVLLQICIFGFGLLVVFAVGRVHLRFIVNHMVQSELTQVKFL
jgi:hypothetical protein